MTDGGEGAFDRVAGADMLPVFRREVGEGEQRLAIFGQAVGGLVVFRLVLGKEAIEGFLGVVAALGHPDFLEVRLGSGLHRLGELVQDVERLVEPTSLMTRDAELLLQRLPEPQERRRRWRVRAPPTDRGFSDPSGAQSRTGALSRKPV